MCVFSYAEKNKNTERPNEKKKPQASSAPLGPDSWRGTHTCLPRAFALGGEKKPWVCLAPLRLGGGEPSWVAHTWYCTGEKEKQNGSCPAGRGTSEEAKAVRIILIFVCAFTNKAFLKIRVLS